jgi:hypothetical protein
VIDEGATNFATANDSVLAFGIQRGIGLRAYALDGRLRFHVLGDEAISSVEAVESYAYVQRAEAGGVIVDLRTGTVRELALRWIPALLVPSRPAY